MAAHLERCESVQPAARGADRLMKHCFAPAMAGAASCNGMAALPRPLMVLGPQRLHDELLVDLC